MSGAQQTLGNDLADLRKQLITELRTLFELDVRLVDEIECVLSVLLAIIVAHLLGATNISWAAFSAYMVMRGHVAESALRGALRIIGTVAGATLAVVLTPFVLNNIFGLSLVAAIIGGLCLYAGMTARHAYAWLFVGVTFEMILLDKISEPDLSLTAFAVMRVLEVVAGTAACVIVSALSALTARRYWPAPATPFTLTVAWHAGAARHAAQGGIALGMLPYLSLLKIPELGQSSITIIAAMLIPVTAVGKSSLVPVSRRLLYRTLGCVTGAILAAIFLFAAAGSATILIVGTCLGVTLGRHIENGRSSIAYCGTQFVLAVLVALVPDSYAHAMIDPALERLASVLIGLLVLEPILLGWHVAAARPRLLGP
jgi:uncharacterized membrane protein YccC